MIKVSLILGIGAVVASAWFTMPSFGYTSDDNTNVDENFVRDAKKEVVINQKTSKMYSDIKPSKKMHFYEAWEYCRSMDLNGYRDWRVITKDEAKELLELSRRELKIKHAFRNVKEELYWTSTQDRYGQSWYVDFDLGRYSTKKETYRYHVLCAREIK